MNFLDNVIGFLSPRRGAERLAWRQEMNLQQKYYDAGGGGRRNYNWRTTNQPAEYEDRIHRDVIRARARDMERNSDMANGLIKALERNTVGKGFELQVKTGDEKLNERIEELWKKWCKARNCDVTGQQSFRQMLKMAVRRKLVDGGILFVKCYTQDGLVPFKLQTLEVDELSLTAVKPKKEGNRVIAGIEYNENNKPVGYWVQQYTIDGYSIPDPKYYSSEDVIFYMSKRRPSQMREISELAPTLSRIRDANELIDAIAMKERVAACFSAFITRQNPSSGGFGRSGTLEKTENGGYDGKRMSPGMIMELAAGDDVKIAQPGNSAAEGNEFLKTEQRLMSAGQGMSYETVSRDMSQTNYSSARQALIEDENTFYDEIDQLKEKIMDEVYETFLISCYLKGLIEAPDFFTNKNMYMNHEWIAAPKRWIDPAKEANATKIALATSQKSFKDICSENGKDWRTQIDDMAEVSNYAKEKGVELGGIGNEKKGK